MMIFDFIYTIIVRIPLIILAMVFFSIFMGFTIILFALGLLADVFLHITGLAKDENTKCCG